MSVIAARALDLGGDSDRAMVPRYENEVLQYYLMQYGGVNCQQSGEILRAMRSEK